MAKKGANKKKGTTKKTTKKIVVKDAYSYYPEIEDNDFVKKIYLKKEFNEHAAKKETRAVEEICAPRKFELQVQQEFVRNYVSSTTPYNGILLFHAPGSGKSCGSISIAEGFKRDKYFDNKTIILTDIQDQFKSQIFNTDLIRQGIKTLENQCTGETYALTDEEMKYLNIDQKVALIKKKIKDNYEIMGPIAFANQVKRDISPRGKKLWTGSRSSLTKEMKERIKRLYSNRVLIIDEVQNIKTTVVGTSRVENKIVPPVIEAVIKYADNLRLVLMSATPMFDKASEIVYLLNLLLLNDGREPIEDKEIFDGNDNFVKGGEKRLREACRGYISYYYGKNPIAFPVRVYPKAAVVPTPVYAMDGSKIPKADKIKFTKLILCPMSEYQEKWYQYYVHRERSSAGDRMSTNLIIPNKDNKGVFSQTSVFDDYPAGKGAFLEKQNRKKFKYFEYKKHSVFKNGETILSKNRIGNYSTKFEHILNNILRAKGGISLVYSFYIWAGVIPFCLVLEQNGFTRYTKGTAEPALLKHKKPDPICYYCSKPKSAKVHQEGAKGYHKFYLAQYIIATADGSINARNAVQVAREVNQRANEDGRMIKVVVGNQVISEGIDFERLRQIHVLEPWYNMSKIEQIIGRGDRFCSHAGLPAKDRNLEVYLYAVTHNKKQKKKIRETETYDERFYARAELKDVKIKRVERILKEEAVDCPLMIAANQFESNLKIKQTTVTGENVTVRLGGEPYTPRCDYEPTCNYKCSWQPKRGTKYKIDDDTYRLQYSQSDIDRVVRAIKRMFKKDVVFNLYNIKEQVRKTVGDVDDLIIFKAIDQLLNTQRSAIQDRYDRDGYLIYRGNTYVYQPAELGDERIPVYYRRKMLTVKPGLVELHKEVFDLPPPEKSGDFKKNDDDIDVSTSAVYQKLMKQLTAFYQASIKFVEEQKIDNPNKYIVAMGCDRLLDKEIGPLLSCLLLKPNKTELDQLIVDYFSKDYFKNKKGEIVAFKAGDSYYCMEKKRYTPCAPDKEHKYKSEFKKRKKPKEPSYKDLGPVYGVMEFKKKKWSFKIVDQTKATGQLTREGKTSGRSQITGKVCTSFLGNALEDISKRIGMIETKMKAKKQYCNLLELLFRYYDDTKKGKKRWLVYRKA